MLSIEHIQSVFENSSTAYIVLKPEAQFYIVAWANTAFFKHTSSCPRDIHGKRISELFGKKCTSGKNVIETVIGQALEQSTEISLDFQRNELCPVIFASNIQSCSCGICPVMDGADTGFIIQKLEFEVLRSAENASPRSSGPDVYCLEAADILESITDCFLAFDRDWTITYWNKQAEKLSGMMGRDILGKNLWEVYPDYYEKNYHLFEQSFSSLSNIQYEEYFPVSKKWIETTARPASNGMMVYFRDITQRKENEEQAEKERQKYQNLFNSSPLPMWVYDIETFQFLDANDAAIRHYGFSREEFLALTLRDIRPEEDIPYLENAMADIQDRHIHQNAVRHRKKDGNIIFVDIESDAIPFDSKKARIVSAADITEKLAAEEALKANEQRFRALIQGSSDLVCIHTKEGEYLYVSPACKSVIGVDAEFYIGKNIFDFVHEDDRKNVYRQFCMLGTRKRVKIKPYRFNSSGNEFRWMETILTDMSDDAAVGGIVSNSRDITQRVENELKVKESIERYNIVSKATSDTIWDWDIKSGKVKWSRGIKGVFGYKEDPDFKIWSESCVHPDDRDRIVDSFNALMQNKKSRLTLEYRFRCADGTYKHVLEKAFLLFDKEGKPERMIGAMQDITPQVNYIKAIEDQNKRLKEISWIQSHIVRAPLARIMGLSKTISDNFQDEGILKEMLPYLYNSVDELDSIIRNIVSKTSTD